MYTQNFEKIFNINKDIPNPLNDWQKITTDYYQRLTKQQMAVMAKLLSRMTSQAKRMTTMRSPDEFIKIQQEIFEENVRDNIELSKDIMRQSLENVEQFNHMFTDASNNVVKKSAKVAKSAVGTTTRVAKSAVGTTTRVAKSAVATKKRAKKTKKRS